MSLTTDHNVNPNDEDLREKCQFDNLPDELLAYIFQLGVEMEAEAWDHDSEASSSEDSDEWENVDDDKYSDRIGENEASPSGTSVSSSVMSLRGPFTVTMITEDDDQYRVAFPFQVLVSHICRRWRSVALGTHRFWTTLSFHMSPNLDQAKEYISRSNGFPLTIELDCSADDDDSDEDDALSGISDGSKDSMTLEELGDILDLLEPAVAHWGKFIFYTSHYDYVVRLMSRLQDLPSAPFLESFQVHIYEDWEDPDSLPDEAKVLYLPFHGQVPKLKEAVFWGIPIDWEGALPNFLSGLRDFELSYLTKDVRPSYPVFAEIIKNSPELRTLTLSLAGPQLADDVDFDSYEAWGPIPLSIPSLTELVLQFHAPKYAAALVQHLDLPNLSHLALNFDEEDYSGFVQKLAKSARGQSHSLLRQISHLKISGLPCDTASADIFLSQLTSLKSLNLKIYGPEEVIFDKLIDPLAHRSTDHTMSSGTDLPTVFCPKLEEMTTTGLDGKCVKKLIIARRDAGAPLKTIHMAISDECEVSSDDEHWIKENVEELYFYDPSDSEEEVSEDDL